MHYVFEKICEFKKLGDRRSAYAWYIGVLESCLRTGDTISGKQAIIEAEAAGLWEAWDERK